VSWLNGSRLPAPTITLKESTGRSLSDNAFGSEGEARQFVEDLGFRIESRPLLGVLDQLGCLQRTRTTRDRAEYYLSAPGQCLWILRR
jgi:hypothetical protein